MDSSRRDAEDLIAASAARVAEYERERFEELASDERILAFVDARARRAYELNERMEVLATSELISMAITALMQGYLTDIHEGHHGRQQMAARARAELAVIWSMMGDEDPSRYKPGTRRLGKIFVDIFTDVEWINPLIFVATNPGSGQYIVAGMTDYAMIREALKHSVAPDIAVAWSSGVELPTEQRSR